MESESASSGISTLSTSELMVATTRAPGLVVTDEPSCAFGSLLSVALVCDKELPTFPNTLSESSRVFGEIYSKNDSYRHFMAIVCFNPSNQKFLRIVERKTKT